MNSTATMINNNKNTIEGDKTRRKRLKVVSACGECRRKKTKCNGEKPCAGCSKARVECKYVTSSKSKSTLEERPSLNTKIMMKPICPTNPSSSIESIEERLATIENILRALLGSGQNKHLLQGLEQQKSEPPTSVPKASSFYPKSSPYQSDSLSPSSSSSHPSLCGDMYSSCSPRLVHVPPIHNRNLPREKRQRHEDECVTDNTNKRIMIRDSHGYHSSLLAPIKIITHQSPGIPTIKNLLNDDEQQQPQPQPQQSHPSAFFRMSHRNNTAQTAAGTST